MQWSLLQSVASIWLIAFCVSYLSFSPLPLAIPAIQSLGETHIELGPATVPADVQESREPQESRDPQVVTQLVGKDGDITDDIIENIAAQASSGSSSEDEQEDREEEEEGEVEEERREEEPQDEEAGGETREGDSEGEEDGEGGLEEGEVHEEEPGGSQLQAPTSTEAQAIDRPTSPRPLSTTGEPSKELGKRERRENPSFMCACVHACVYVWWGAASMYAGEIACIYTKLMLKGY